MSSEIKIKIRSICVFEMSESAVAIYPKMESKGSMPATQEIHIFLGPLNPEEESLQRYYEATNLWNRDVYPQLIIEASNTGSMPAEMKPCHLALIFRKDGEDNQVRVMQSARYYRCNDTEKVIAQAQEDAQWFKEHGFAVLRTKIEASAYGIEGIPQTDEQAEAFNGYFEFHIKVCRKDLTDTSPIDEKEIEQLKAVSRYFTQVFKVPIPLSFNVNHNKTNQDGKGHQRFLNLRFRKTGLVNIKPRIEEIKQQIDETTNFRVVKVISEYVWYDTYPEMDHGWIDFTPEEFTQAYPDQNNENENDDEYDEYEYYYYETESGTESETESGSETETESKAESEDKTGEDDDGEGNSPIRG